MINQSFLSCAGQMSTLKRTRTSILRPKELVEIQGSYWPRILVLSESAERGKKTYGKNPSLSPIKGPRSMNRKELERNWKKLSTISNHRQRPASPFEASSNALASISTIDQNISPSWQPIVQQSKTKTSSFTGRVVVSQQDKTKNHPVGQPSSGLKGPRRRKALKDAVAPR